MKQTKPIGSEPIGSSYSQQPIPAQKIHTVEHVLGLLEISLNREKKKDHPWWKLVTDSVARFTCNGRKSCVGSVESQSQSRRE